MIDVPVVLFLFKRKDTALRVIERVRIAAPKRLYLLSDEGRDDDERALVSMVRSAVEEAIDWECELVKCYATENRGVYVNIALGAKWVFEREESAIFLEDDNLPEVSFFRYCAELLDRYRNNQDILWICGTNYLEEFHPEDGASYIFTQHLLPCGWASWRDKFNTFYDFDLSAIDDPNRLSTARKSYESSALFRQQLRSVRDERRRFENGSKFISWDFHMAWSLRSQNLLGIAPVINQIENIGVDSFSEHGGSSFDFEMTERFCGIESDELTFPLIHPSSVSLNAEFELETSKVILLPRSLRFRGFLRRKIGTLTGIGPDVSITSEFRECYERFRRRKA